MRDDPAAMAGAVDDEMIDAFAVVGTPDEARRKLAVYADLADTICLTPPDQLIDPRQSGEYREALLATFGE